MTPNYYLWTLIGMLFVLIAAPPMTFLLFGWRTRRNDVVGTFTDTAIRKYFQAFHPLQPVEDTKLRAEFDRYYRSQFGLPRFIVPVFLFFGICGAFLIWSGLSLNAFLINGEFDSKNLPALSVVAFAGALLWIINDEINRCHTGCLNPSDIYGWCFRAAIAVPMGYAVRNVFTESLSFTLVFFLGAFPTSQLLSISRRFAAKKLDLQDPESGSVTELEKIDGVDVNRGGQFEAENITTISQLAYCDPIRLTIRTGLNYSYITDCICQALLLMYVKDKADIAKFQKAGLRSAYEVLTLWIDLHEDPATARTIMAQLAADLGSTPDKLQNIIMQIALDPYTEFLYLSWSGDEKHLEVLGNLPPITS